MAELVEDRCRHCRERIVLVEYISGVKWMHEPADVAGQVDAMYVFCKLTTAESALMETRELERRHFAEEGRRLASLREDLIAQGVDPNELPVPLHPDDPTGRRRAAAGQQVTSTREQSGEVWWWWCDHAHEISAGPVPFTGTSLTQDGAYTALNEHNAQHHPHITPR